MWFSFCFFCFLGQERSIYLSVVCHCNVLGIDDPFSVANLSNPFIKRRTCLKASRNCRQFSNCARAVLSWYTVPALSVVKGYQVFIRLLASTVSSGLSRRSVTVQLTVLLRHGACIASTLANRDDFGPWVRELFHRFRGLFRFVNRFACAGHMA